MPKINPRIKSIDDLLGLDAAEERPIEPTPSVSLPTKNTIITLPPQAIRAFRGHPFRLYEGDRLNDLVESISEHGVLNPAIIRKIEHKYGLDNLIVFVDYNNLQLDGTCDEIMPNGDLGEKFKAFGWETLELDGHSMEEIVACIDKCYASKNGKPKCLYAHTVKGKGVSFMENQCGWHGVAPNDEQYAQAMAELKAQLID